LGFHSAILSDLVVADREASSNQASPGGRQRPMEWDKGT
jgi:hypothetical protein